MLIVPFISRLRRRFGRPPLAGLVVLAALSCVSAQGAVVAVVLSDDTAPYQEATAAVEAALRPGHTVVRVQAGKLAISGGALSRASVIVTVGVKAADLIAAQGGTTPVLAVLVTEDWYQSRGRTRLGSGGRSVGAVVLEQPLSRQLRLIRSAFPAAGKIGVVVSPRNAGMLETMQAAAEAEGLVLVGAVAESETALLPTLVNVLKEADLLLAVPDAEALNRNTVQSVLMTTYRYRDPMVGYSQALSRAGALVSLYSSPEQVGRQAGELTARVLNGSKLPGLQWPRYFSVSVNEHVARSLGIDVPAEEALLNGLGGGND